MTDITFFSSKLLSVYLWVQPWCLEEAQCQVGQVCPAAWRDQHSGRCYPWQGLPQNWSRTAEEIEKRHKKKKHQRKYLLWFWSFQFPVAANETAITRAGISSGNIFKKYKEAFAFHFIHQDLMLQVFEIHSQVSHDSWTSLKTTIFHSFHREHKKCAKMHKSIKWNTQINLGVIFLSLFQCCPKSKILGRPTDHP